MIKKLVALFLVATVILSFCACGNKDNDDTPANTEEYVLPTEIIDADISLPYTSAEGFDPYTINSSYNRDLIPVLFECLYLPTHDGQGAPILASDGKVKGKVITVTIKNNVGFSDGTALTADAVKDSFEKAKLNDYYSGTLSNVKSVKCKDDYTVVFELAKESLFTLNILNFPIVKYDGKKVVGSGKYKLQYLDKTPYLRVNTAHRDFSSQWNKQIALCDMAGKNGPVYSFKANEISVYKNYLSGEEYVNLSSQTTSESLNNLVYIGVNSKWAGSLTSVDWVRHAMNIGIDRAAVSASSFLGQTSPTITPFRNELFALKTEELPALNGEIQKAVGILERNGYDKVNADGIRTNGSSTLKVSILVCAENPYKVGVAEAVKDSLADMGFGVTIKEKKTSEEFTKALNEGHFDLYIGETRLSYDYGLESFFSTNGKLNYGIDEAFYKEYELFENGESTLSTFVESFETEVPFIPIFYRKAIVSVNPNITNFDKYDIYSSVCDWKIVN